MNSNPQRIAAVVLAAGESKRFGAENKLLHKLEGKSLLQIAVEAIGSVELVDLVVVLGHEAERIEASLKGLSLRFVMNPDYRSGMGSSLRAGISALDEESLDGVLVCLADLPGLKGGHVATVVDRFCSEDGDRVVVPVFEGHRGHPVCFPNRFLAGLKSLEGDKGARDLIRSDPSGPILVEMSDRSCVQDLDQI